MKNQGRGRKRAAEPQATPESAKVLKTVKTAEITKPNVATPAVKATPKSTTKTVIKNGKNEKMFCFKKKIH